jgi:tRNA(Ile)-lysidine synthase
MPGALTTDLLPLAPLPPLVPRARVWVAVSGGFDSLSLLHRLAALRVPGLRAVHVHHGLQAAADDWARQVRRQCRALGVPLSLRRVSVEAGSEGPEAAARGARHAVFAELLKPGDLLVTAHQRNDQAETVLLRALRGSGVEGLGAMPVLAPYGPARIWRPLLATPRTAIERYARHHGLAVVDDPHNRDPRYARAYLRHEIWPLLQAHWPQADASLARLAGHAQETAVLLVELAVEDARRLGLGDTGATGLELPIEGLQALSAARRRNLLRGLWARRGWRAPAADWWVRLEREVLAAREDAQPRLPFEHGEARRYRERLYLMPALPPVPVGALRWARGRACGLPPGCGQLRADIAPPRPLTVRFPGGGERLRVAGAAHHRSLKQLCQQAGVPVWVRERLPLIYDGARLLSVAGVWNAAELAELKGFAPRWHCELPGWPFASV